MTDAPPPVPQPAAQDHDPARRAFFRAFGRQAVTTVGQVAGMADALGLGGSTRVAMSLLGLEEPAPARPAPRPPTPLAAGTMPRPGSATPAPASRTGYRSPYRLEGDVLLVLDQRSLPSRQEDLACRRGGDVAFYLRVGAARGGALMAQLAAYGIVLEARHLAAEPGTARLESLARLSRTLAEARPSARLVGWAVERMGDVAAGFPGDDQGPAAAEALLTEADAIATRLQLDQATIARHLVELLPQPADRPLSVLVHGDPGTLSGGLVGTAVTALATLASQGRELRVRLTEGRPFLEGARLAALELRQAGIPYQVLPDAAAAWLLAGEPVDAVLLAAERVAADGAVATLVGGRAIALAAAAGGPAGPVPFLVAAPAAAFDPATPDAAAMPLELRPGRELTAFQPAVAADRSNALNPATDVVPAALVTVLVTERGPIRAPDARRLAALLAGDHGTAPSAGQGQPVSGTEG